jgi:ELWxxDGT repeat protein
MRNILSLFLLLVCLPVGAQTPYLVKDINTTNSNNLKSSTPAQFAAFGNRTFFVATTDAAGAELWSTDGTSSGTAMVADIIPGTGSSSPSGLKVVNGILLFTARDVNHGIELWTSDGTAAGTHLFMDINPGPNSSQPATRVLYRNQMLFSADDGTNGRELWTTDGTVAGTHMVKDISPGSASSSPNYLNTLNDSVYFLAAGGLWKTDGTDAGTVKVASVFGRNLCVSGSRLFFEGFTATAGWEPWVSDGTDAGTHMIADIFPGSNGALDTLYSNLGFTPYGNGVLFPADDGVHGRELWISDGTSAGTRLVRDLLPGAQGTWDDGYANINVIGDHALFKASDAAHGQELWVTDGTDAGTALFADLSPGPTSSYPSSFVASGGKLYFTAVTSFLVGSDLWVTDGTTAGTHTLGEASGLGLGFGSISMWNVNGKMYFSGWTSLSGGEPWVTDGTEAGTRMIANLAPDGPPSSNPSNLTAAGNLLFFTATEGLLSPTSNVAESSLWRSDGTASGTYKLMETGQHPDVPLAFGTSAFFSVQAANNSKTTEWITDGTLAGTKPADDFFSRFGTNSLGGLFPFGDTMFATVFDLGVYESSLWKTTAAPNAAATRLGAHNPDDLTEVAGNYFFYSQAPSGMYNYGLWRTDGTAAGTYGVVPELQNDNGSLSRLVNAGGTVFFLKRVQGENMKLWKSDGTMDGTVVVKELPINGSQFVSEIKAAGRRVFFVIGGSLWTSDGTESGTIDLTNVRFYPVSSAEDNLRVAGSRMVFAQWDSTKGFELWTSDGSVQGTKLLQPLQTDPGLTSIDGTVYFKGTDDQHGTEMWTTDGTTEGTKLLVDLNPGVGSSNPYAFTKAGNLLYFYAYTDATGGELWALPLTDPHLSISDARATEGDTGTTVARFNVSLAPVAKQAVTVDYATTDGTARAGEDYDAASGTLTFAAGETVKTIDVRVRGDVLPENNETFFVTLRNTNGAGLIKAEGAGIIDDDDQTADLGIVPQFESNSTTLNNFVKVSNAGPRAATDVTLRMTATPSYSTQRCTACPIPQIANGTSTTAAGESSHPGQQIYVSATASARQRDPQLSNNTALWTVNGDGSMGMNAAYLTTGATATVSTTIFTSSPAITSSDASVVSVSPAVSKVSSTFGTFTVTGLKTGTSTINVDGRQYPLLVTVVAAGTTPLWPGGVTLAANTTSIRFDQPLLITVTPSGTAPVSGAVATGTVIVSTAGHEVARQGLSGKGLVLYPVYLPALGSVPYTIAYSGDANFLPQSLNGTVSVSKGVATLTGAFERVPGTTGSFALTVHASGSLAAAPSGILSILNGTTEVARVPLAPSNNGLSDARFTVANLPASPTLTLNYLGDAFYFPGSQQMRLVEPRRRAAGH